jgi:hypothetical protein
MIPYPIMYPRREQSYGFVPQDENEKSADFSLFRIVLGRSRFFVLGLLVILTIVITSSTTFSHRSESQIWSSCGNDTTTARARGCSFDLISFAWQTPECYDSSLVADFVAWDTWEFYTEKYGNTTVAQDVVLMGEESLWVTW